MSQLPRIRFGVLCDDVRREDNGKLLFIGVYGASVLVGGFPAALTFANPIWFELKESFEGPVWSQALLDDITITEAKGFARLTAGNPLLSIQPIPVEVPREGVLSFQLKFSEHGDWQTTLSVPIRLNPSANASPPPTPQT
jgi:hypothetical protein